MITKWIIPKKAFQSSFAELARDGKNGTEGIALWLGTCDMSIAIVTHVGLLRGKGIIRRPNLLQIDAAVFNVVTDVAVKLGIYLIGQIHSHGPGVGTFLSRPDRTMGVLSPGYLSSVCPDYGLRRHMSPNDCGFYFYNAAKGFVQLSVNAIKEKIELSRKNVTVLEIKNND